MRVVADGGALACLNRCVLAALGAPPARAQLLCAATRAASSLMVLCSHNLQTLTSFTVLQPRFLFS